MIDEPRLAGEPSAFHTIILGGLAIGVLDFIDASTFFPLYFGITVARVWQSVAAGVLGREAAVAGGWNTAALGIFLHFVVAFSIAAVYFFLSRNVPLLVRRPVISGLVYGIVANYVMQFVVIPLSALGWRSSAFDLGSTLNSVVGHAFLVGLPVALIANWSAKKDS